MGALRPKFLGGQRHQNPPKMGGKRGDKGGGVRFFSVFNLKTKKKMEKYLVHFVGNLSRIPKLFFFFILAQKLRKFYSFIYIYVYLYIYLYIYKKLSPKWKTFHEQKAFLFRFYILCENFSKIGPIIKKWGGKGGPQGVQILLFSMFIFIIYLSNTQLFSNFISM